MSLFDDAVDEGILELKKVTTSIFYGLTGDNTINVATIHGYAASTSAEGEFIFSDEKTPEQESLLGEVNTLLDNYVKATQQLVQEIEYDLNDIFRP